MATADPGVYQWKAMQSRPARYGLASLLVAGIAWALWPLVVVLGPGVAIVQIPCGLVAVVAGLVGVVAGIRQRNATAIVSGAVGLTLIGVGMWFVIHSLLNF